MIIKLTHVSGVVMYVNSDNIIQFFNNTDNVTTLMMVGGQDDVKETPEQICEMLGADV